MYESKKAKIKLFNLSTFISNMIMKKKILSLAIAAVAVITVATSASAEQPSRNCCADTTVCATPCKHKCGCPSGKQRNERRDGRRCADSTACNLFNGIALTAEQQAAINAIPTPRQVMKAAATQPADTTVCRADLMREARANYLDAIEKVLTPEQYTQFLENFYVSQPMHKAKKDKAPKSKHRKHGTERTPRAAR